MSNPFADPAILLLDGAMGTMLQARGLPPGARPELWNLENPAAVQKVHQAYVAAGSQVLYANTFGAYAPKLANTGRTVEEVVAAGVGLAKAACQDASVQVALDLGPLGAMLEPLGALSFEEAYRLFAQTVQAGVKAGADLIVIETMGDLYEAKAALLAAKENARLPVAVTMTFEESGRTFAGCSIPSMAHTLEGLGADAIGLNCSLGPVQLAPLIRELCSHTRLPVIAKPNAGMPDPLTGAYDMGPAAFAKAMLPCLEAGASIFGGCCGTDPAYIQALAQSTAGKLPAPRPAPTDTCYLCTPRVALPLDRVRVIGERINPTGKKRFQQALLEEDLDYILGVGIQQADAGAEILDVNVGFPGVNEVEMLPKVVKKLQSVLPLPLQLDSSDPAALEAGLRVYNGKPAVNSVNGDPAVLSRILPLAKRYGAAVVGLTLDQGGLPQSAQERLALARRILEAALAQGIPRRDLWIDCLTLTISAQQDQARETLEAIRQVREELGLQTTLGISNISFGLPQRIQVTRSFLIQALGAGLTLPILNPNQPELMDAVAACRAISGEDAGCRDYIARFAQAPQEAAPAASGAMTLEEAIRRGFPGAAARLAREALQTEEGLSLVETRLIPALDRVGLDYEQGIAFLPQLMGAAQAAQAVFQEVAAQLEKQGGAPVKKGPVILATVRGDIHDIGKNIVKTLMENYGFRVIDLGRDVPVEAVVEAARKHQAPLVGLSALMTTTLPAMEQTIAALKAMETPPAVLVGGAVVTPEHARRMGADYYAKDARQSVEIARKVLG